MKKLTAIVVGFGARGARYAEYALDHPDEMEIVAVADPVPVKLESAKQMYNLPDNMLFADWRDLAALPRMADFAIIGTMDKLHFAPAMALIEQGYDLLLEKPIAPTAWECKAIVEAAEKKGVKVVVCHLMRYIAFWQKVKELLDDGAIGEIKSIDHMMIPGIALYAHAFVRGNWRNAAEASCFILQKCCHDMDTLQWLIGKQCKKVHSFGSLSHFNQANQPKGAPDRCLDGCPYYETCVYSVKRQYFDHEPISYYRRVACNTVEETTDEQLRKALQTGPYGRCVYACDNDVVDHQVVNMEFEGGCTVSFSVSAFGEYGSDMRIHGTKGELLAQSEKHKITVFPFDTCEHIEYNIPRGSQSYKNGHDGGDQAVVQDALRYFNGEIPKNVSSIRTSYMSHLIAFAAEESRLSGRVIDLDRYAEEV